MFWDCSTLKSPVEFDLCKFKIICQVKWSMGRCYQSKAKTSRLFKYSNEQMQDALHEVKRGDISLRAADKYGICVSKLKT